MKVMGTSRALMGTSILVIYMCFAATFFTHCDARKSVHIFKASMHSRISRLKQGKKAHTLKRLDIITPLDSTNAQPYGVSSPFSLPPFDSLGPMPLPESTPPFCEYPPFTPQLPSPSISTPIGGGEGGYTPSSPLLPIQSPPPSPTGSFPNPPQSFPPQIILSPPINIPSPTGYIPNPPIYIPSPTEPVLGPPYYEPSPPSYIPSPSGRVPIPPVFQPPVVYPPPTGIPPPSSGSNTVLWCVAKPSVPEPIIQEAMNYACASGADCDSIQPNQPCFEPNTLFAHASYAFNSYWQRTKVGGGTCQFGGTAILVTLDPSYDGCHYIYY